MKFNHIHPIYTNETERKDTLKEKYEKIYGLIIEQRKNKDGIIAIRSTI